MTEAHVQRKAMFINGQEPDAPLLQGQRSPDALTRADDGRWTRLRRELIQWLNDRAPSFTQAYEAAVILLHTPDFPARTNLICHVVRDIYRHLPAALGVQATARSGEVLPSMVKRLADQWDRFPPQPGQRPDAIGSDALVSREVYNELLTLIRRHSELRVQPSVGQQLAGVLFRSGDRRDDQYIHPWVIEAFDSEYKYFVSRAHLATSRDRIKTDADLLDHFISFERAFHSLIGPYFSGKEELDAILQDTNSAAN